jgi:hypothetical protein
VTRAIEAFHRNVARVPATGAGQVDQSQARPDERKGAK